MTLNEAARANGSMGVDLTGAGIGGAPIQVTLAASGDAAVWTGSHTVTGTDEGGLNAVLDVSTVIDAAGNYTQVQSIDQQLCWRPSVLAHCFVPANTLIRRADSTSYFHHEVLTHAQLELQP